MSRETPLPVWRISRPARKETRDGEPPDSPPPMWRIVGTGPGTRDRTSGSSGDSSSSTHARPAPAAGRRGLRAARSSPPPRHRSAGRSGPLFAPIRSACEPGGEQRSASRHRPASAAARAAARTLRSPGSVRSRMVRDRWSWATACSMASGARLRCSRARPAAVLAGELPIPGVSAGSRWRGGGSFGPWPKACLLSPNVG